MDIPYDTFFPSGIVGACTSGCGELSDKVLPGRELLNFVVIDDRYDMIDMIDHAMFYKCLYRRTSASGFYSFKMSAWVIENRKRKGELL